MRNFLTTLSLALIAALMFTALPQFASADNTTPEPAEEQAAEPVDTGKADGTIQLPAEGRWIWWVMLDREKTLKPPATIDSDTIEWSLEGDDVRQGTIYVLNEKTGNVARILITDAAGEQLELTDADFKLVHRFSVRVISKDGDAVSAASVTLEDRDGNVTSRVIDASDEGVAEFYDIPAGRVILSVGSGDVSITQEVTIQQDRDEAVARAEVVLAGDVPVLGDAEPVDEETEEREATGGLSFVIIAWLFSIILLAIIVFVVLMVLKSRQTTLRSALEKAGVAIDDGIPEATPIEEPIVPSLDPDQVGPAPALGPDTGHMPQAAPTSGPKLVGTAGSYIGAIFPISAGSSLIIGRESTCDIALPMDNTVSRRHALISSEGGVIKIRDEGSSNGTLVNGQTITEQQLNSGDEIQVGSTRFRFEA